MRWTAPAAGNYLIDTVFTGLDSQGATTDVHVVLNGGELFAGDIRGGLDTPANVASYRKTVSVAKGDKIDFAVGPGGNGNVCDSTGLSAKITAVGGLPPQPAARTIAYWRFEEGPAGAAATGKILDSSGNNLHGIPQNGPVYSANVPMRSIYSTDAVNACSLSFDGASQIVYIPDSPLFELTRSLTLEAFVNVQELPRHGMVDFIVIRGDNRPWLDPYWLGLLPNGHFCFQIDDGSTPDGENAVQVEAPNVTPLNTWLHVVGTLNDATGEMCLYIDGHLATSTVTPRRPFAVLEAYADPGVAIGGCQQPGNGLQCFHGLIDEVRISDAALTPSEFLNAVPKSSRIAVAELSSAKPRVLRPAKEPARAAGCEVSKPGPYKAAPGDLIELEYTYPAPPAAAPAAVEVKQTPNGAVAASPLGTRTVDAGPAGRRTVVFYFEAKKAGNDTVTLLIDGTPYTYHFQVSEPQPAATQAPAIRVYRDQLDIFDRLTDGSAKLIEISEPTRLVWVDLESGLPFPHNSRYVLATASGVRVEQAQWWPELNGRPIWFPSWWLGNAAPPPVHPRAALPAVAPTDAAIEPAPLGPFKFVRVAKALHPLHTSSDGKLTLELNPSPLRHPNAALVVEVGTHKPAGKPFYPLSPPSCWSFSPDGKYLATGWGHKYRGRGEPQNQGAIQVWDAATGTRVGWCHKYFDATKRGDAPVLGSVGSVTSLAFSPDGREIWFQSEDYEE